MELYVARIEAIDRSGPLLRSVIELNPEAQSIAAQLDKERKDGSIRGPMHGIPILLKDNIGTGDRMATSAGSLALGSPASRRTRSSPRGSGRLAPDFGQDQPQRVGQFPRDSLLERLEWPGRTDSEPLRAAPEPVGLQFWFGGCGLGQSLRRRNRHRDRRLIVSPCSVNGIVGLKPTLGLLSRNGIVPVAHSQDTAGPMARSVRDVAILLAALTGVDRDDPATAEATGKSRRTTRGSSTPEVSAEPA